MEVLNVDHETGLATYIGPALYDLMDTFKVVAVHLDSEHELYFLCAHPVTAEWAWHSVIELVQPEIEKPKLTSIGINTK